VYIDPNAPAPPAKGLGAAVGNAGSSLSDIVTAANNGTLRVDPATGDATIRALSSIWDEVEQARRRMARGGRQTKLGGGYAQQIDSFNQEWTTGANGSALATLTTFQNELRRLEEAVRRCMATYEHDDAVGAENIRRAGR